MKSEFKAKYIQHLLGKKKNNEGFTLIELLVVIIIVGVLAAIALPSFLNQVNKARGSEGKSNLGTINRAQQAFRLENNRTATQLADLDARVSGKFYTYEVNASTTAPNVAFATATIPDTAEDEKLPTELKSYVSAVRQYNPAATETYPEYFGQVVCESIQNNAAVGGTNIATASTENNVQSTCPAGYLVAN
jgi:type IV pilus assembly protein PilA